MTTTPITLEHLENLVVAVDTAVEDRGWNEGPLLLKIDNIGSDGLDFGMKEIDGHPLNTLLGFTAPDEWAAIGVSAEGWAASLDSPVRPSQSKGRMRMRTTVLVSRDGIVASGMRLAGEELKQMGEGEGTVLDALKRAIGVPTAPPAVPFEGWVARMLLTLVIGGMPSYEHLLEEARAATTPEAFSQLRRQLKAWGLPVRLRRKAA